MLDLSEGVRLEFAEAQLRAPARFVWALLGGLVLSCSSRPGAGGVYLAHEIAWRQAEIQQLREAMAVQTVQLHDARERIPALEVDMDHVAPHTLAAPSPRP